MHKEKYHEIKQGAKAAASGKNAERILEDMFVGMGLPVVMYSSLEMQKTKEIVKGHDAFVMKNVPYKSIYSGIGRTEFVLVNKEEKTRIEVKYQESAGSVDEKFPYMFHNALGTKDGRGYPESNIIFVVDGGGYREGARRWLVEAIEEAGPIFNAKGKTVNCFYINEFCSWISAYLAA